ncbi:MAG: universal stress protein [Dehalococcoidales bacterium]|nr:universal stress protein [Dehalococcoidales bacterium]
MWKKILVPLDGSDLAELALPYAQELVSAFDSELILLYVSEPAEHEYLHMHQLYLEKVAVQMKKLVKRVSPLVVSGKPAEEIVKYTEKNDIGLIIMASHGRSGIIPWATGGIASKVIDATGVPLLLIKTTKPRRKTKGKHLISRILLPLDGSEAGEAAITRVKELKFRFEAEVILLEVVPEGRHLRTVGGLDYILFPEQELETFKAEANAYLGEVYKRLQRSKGELKIEIRSGEVAKEILNYAKRKKASLIAISSHGHSGMTKWVFGSTAQEIIQDSPIPVLVVKATPGTA